MLDSESALLDYLDQHAIPYQRVQHPPVYTCEQAELYRPAQEGASTKNLFLRDDRRQFYLVMTDCARQVDLKALSRSLAAPKLHFASPESLLAVLGVTPGAVTVLGLVNDGAHQVRLVVDQAVWESATLLCHPLVNTATLALARRDLERFFALTGHTPQVVEMRERG